VARLLFVFLDGVGLGGESASTNPFAAAWPDLHALAGAAWTADAWSAVAEPRRVRRSLDAALGVPGMPQSATGQTTLLTGHNAAAAMGRHYGPWPGPTLRALLRSDGLFHVARTLGGAALANAYPRAYSDAVRDVERGASVDASGRRRRLRASAPIVAATAAGVVIPDMAAFADGRAVAADLDGRALAAYAPEVAIVPELLGPRAQAGVLARLAERHAFTFLDVWSSDRAGHRRDLGEANAFVARLETFLVTLRTALADDVTLLITSDHGNLEDLSSARHTESRVPLLALGPQAGAFARVASLLDVAGAATHVLRAS
jgi:2,3-bisphosphoglycerate-independent phosphoglycerate mutase